MKKIKSEKKLSLNKQTLVKLNQAQINAIKGGIRMLGPSVKA